MTFVCVQNRKLLIKALFRFQNTMQFQVVAIKITSWGSGRLFWVNALFQFISLSQKFYADLVFARGHSRLKKEYKNNST